MTVRTVLIVEDEWAIADWLEVLLSENGYNVLVASNGREALDILHRETPDLVLTDFMMPFVDGAGLIAAMQEKYCDDGRPDFDRIVRASDGEPGAGLDRDARLVVD